jgi:SAM-dependent methyltransferase
VLERIIFPYILSHHNPQSILDIGREDYQKFYNEFFAGRDLWTMDIDPERSEFGAANHITDNAANVRKHFDRNRFDLILINGVLNWGLNNKSEIEKCFKGLYEIMKPGGILVIGWNDFEDAQVTRPEDIEAIKKFKAFYFKPLKGESFKCVNGEHVYNFYTK